MPLVKIGYLFVRTIAKPFSGIIKKQAKDHPPFRRTCIRFAQFYHRIDVRLRRRLASRAGEGISNVVKPLDEQKAIELGAAFIGEAIIFGVAGIVLIVDSARNHRAEIQRRRATEEKFTQLFERMDQLAQEKEQLQSQLSLLTEQYKVKYILQG